MSFFKLKLANSEGSSGCYVNKALSHSSECAFLQEALEEHGFEPLDYGPHFVFELTFLEHYVAFYASHSSRAAISVFKDDTKCESLRIHLELSSEVHRAMFVMLLKSAIENHPGDLLLIKEELACRLVELGNVLIME